MCAGAGQSFTGARVHWLGHAHGLKNLRQRLRDAHWLTAKEIAAELGIGRETLRCWRNNGHLLARLCNDKGEWLYRPASEQLSLPPKPSTPARAGVAGPSATSLQEVQYEECSFEIDVLACPRCGGRLRLIAIVEDPRRIREVLAGLARSAEPVERAPPSQESFAANQTADVCA